MHWIHTDRRILYKYIWYFRQMQFNIQKIHMKSEYTEYTEYTEYAQEKEEGVKKKNQMAIP